MLGRPFGYSVNNCNKSLLMNDFIPFLSSYAHFFTATHAFFHFSDTCYFGSNGSTKFLESTIVFDSFLEGHSSTGFRML
jgi:hypothetical protein